MVSQPDRAAGSSRRAGANLSGRVHDRWIPAGQPRRGAHLPVQAHLEEGGHSPHARRPHPPPDRRVVHGPLAGGFQHAARAGPAEELFGELSRQRARDHRHDGSEVRRRRRHPRTHARPPRDDPAWQAAVPDRDQGLLPQLRASQSARGGCTRHPGPESDDRAVHDAEQSQRAGRRPSGPDDLQAERTQPAHGVCRTHRTRPVRGHVDAQRRPARSGPEFRVRRPHLHHRAAVHARVQAVHADAAEVQPRSLRRHGNPEELLQSDQAGDPERTRRPRGTHLHEQPAALRRADVLSGQLRAR